MGVKRELRETLMTGLEVAVDLRAGEQLLRIRCSDGSTEAPHRRARIDRLLADPGGFGYGESVWITMR